MAYDRELEVSDTSDTSVEHNIDPLNENLDSSIVSRDSTITENKVLPDVETSAKPLPTNTSTPQNKASPNDEDGNEVNFPTRYLMVPEENINVPLVLTTSGFMRDDDQSLETATVITNNKPNKLGLMYIDRKSYLVFIPNEDYWPLAIQLPNLKSAILKVHTIQLTFRDTEDDEDPRVRGYYNEISLLKLYHKYENFEDQKPNYEAAKALYTYLVNPQSILDQLKNLKV